MKKMNKTMALSTAVAAGLGLAGHAALAADATISVDASKSGAKISPLLYGIFYEEINRAGDGGLYAEMLENRSFEDSGTVTAWSTNGKAVLSIDKSHALNSQNPSALKVEVGSAGGGAINAGFKGVGLAVKAGTPYVASFYARSGGNYGPIEVHLENLNGGLLAKATVAQIGTGWKKYSVTLTPSATDIQARLVIQGSRAGTFYLDQTSLMPAKTWKKDVPLRVDLAQRVESMTPKFIRFPGGCFVEGDKMANATRWKETIGDVAQRPGHWNLWGYRSTDGLGAYEFFNWCEKLGAQPLYVINCGMAHGDHIEMDKLAPFVQDALDIIEFANGPVTSKWGAQRAKMGHPKPFGLKYMEVGNEEGGQLYKERYAVFYDAIKAKYPYMNLVSTDYGAKSDGHPLEIVDEHYYNTPQFFRERANMYDSYSRTGPKVYVGEYAVTEQCGKGNLDAALGEAAFMTGLERNADVVSMASYAPLLVNPDWAKWNPNAIVFDQSRSYGTPSYWVQTMFSHNRGDVVVPLQIKAPAVKPEAGNGIVGVGTWATQAEFKDIRVENNGKVLYQSDFTSPDEIKKWRLGTGDWSVVDGALRQTSSLENAQAHIGGAAWGDNYTLSLKARKISGNEGFLISFRAPTDSVHRWWNLGGWGNSGNGLENVGTTPRLDGKIETGRWYDIKIVAQGSKVQCYLDGALLQSAQMPADAAVFGVASRTKDGKNLILKVVNTSAKPLSTTVALKGLTKVAASADATVLSSGSNQDENTFERPNNIIPQQVHVAVKPGGFTHTFPANSVTILRLKTG